MKIIVTASFEKDYKKIFKGKEDLRKFCLQLKRKSFFNLKYPFQKYKFNFLGVSLRGVVAIGIKDFYIPVFIIKKSNKKYGMNLIITPSFFKTLLGKYSQIDNEIKEGNYQEF